MQHPEKKNWTRDIGCPAHQRVGGNHCEVSYPAVMMRAGDPGSLGDGRSCITLAITHNTAIEPKLSLRDAAFEVTGILANQSAEPILDAKVVLDRCPRSATWPE